MVLTGFWMKHRATILIGAGAFLFGFGGGFYIQLKLKEAAFHEMANQALEAQTALQEKADQATAEYHKLSGQLEKANEDLGALHITLATASERMRQSSKNLTGRLAASPSSCVKGESVRNLVRVYADCTSLVQESNRALTRCAKDAGQCGIDRRALLNAWPDFGDNARVIELKEPESSTEK